jgi:hypothetical protein
VGVGVLFISFLFRIPLHVVGVSFCRILERVGIGIPVRYDTARRETGATDPLSA